MSNPLETAVTGYVEISNCPYGLAIGGYSRKSAESVRAFTQGDATVTNMKRARWIAREFHDWDIKSEAELNTLRMRGELAH
jgi:hypothetical protein